MTDLAQLRRLSRLESARRWHSSDPLARIARTDVLCRLVDEAVESCSLGLTHSVGWWQIKRVWLDPDEYRTEWIEGLNYTKGGWGEIQVAFDTQGRRYERRPGWDGYHLWTLGRDAPESQAFWPRLWRPFDVHRDLTGRRIGLAPSQAVD